MTDFNHIVYLSDGTKMTAAEYEAMRIPGEDNGYEILKRAFKETQEKWQLENNSGTPTK